MGSRSESTQRFPFRSIYMAEKVATYLEIKIYEEFELLEFRVEIPNVNERIINFMDNKIKLLGIRILNSTDILLNNFFFLSKDRRYRKSMVRYQRYSSR